MTSTADRHRNSTPSRLLPLLLLIVLGAFAPTTLTAQSAADILQSAADRHAENLRGIDDYTVVQEVMGMTTTMYFERGPDGEFQSRIVGGVGGASTVSMSDFAPNEPEQFTRMAEAAVYAGTETLDGRQVHVIRYEDLSVLQDYMESHGMGGDRGGEMVPETMETWIDADRLVPLRLETHGTMTMNGRSGPVTSTVVMEDYREVGGMLYPFTTRIQTTGMAELMDISPDQLEEMQSQMEEMTAQMERMPAAQREMMERMMGDQLDRLRDMLTSGAMAMTVTVVELRVNEGPPGG